MLRQLGPYRVEEQLGAGGMGEVYKAYDDRLDRWVAIKRIRGDRGQAEENRERFQREARATARLNHPSIVHLYDIFQDGDNDCIVMELVEGVTLDTLLRHGPLDPRQAAGLGYEIASGLAEAHAKGIIHRDLKVENIIVTPDGHAKILDFGLARPLLEGNLDASLTGKGQLVGTSRAMSPEYVGGEEIDHRSDLFSLGVLIYEAVTGHSPFRAHNTMATLKHVMLHHQTPAHLVSSNVPQELSAVIEELLAKDPADRPQSALEVTQRLGRLSERLSSGDVERPQLSSTFVTTPTEVFTPSATSVDAWGRRRWLTIAALLAAGVAATYFVTRWWLEGPPPIPLLENVGAAAARERSRIVLADFQNHTGEPLLDDSIELAFRVGLERSRRASVLPKSQIQAALSRMKRDLDTPVDRELGIEIGQREGARAVVIGAMVKIGETYSLSAEIVDLLDGTTTFSTTASAASANTILDALESVTKEVRLNLGESLAAIEESQRPLEKVTTKDLEALKAYSVGVRKIAEGQDEAAIQLLERAIEIDPEFAMAYAKLATVYIYLDLDNDKILQALDSALRLSYRLTELERLYVEGWAARLHGQPEEGIRTWRLMSSLFPEEYTGHFNLGVTSYLYLEDYAAAARAFAAAARVAEPENLAPTLIQLGYCQIALGQLKEAGLSFEKASGEAQQLARVDLDVAARDYAQGQDAATALTAHPSRLVQIKARLRLAQIFASLGRYEDGLREARLASELADKEGYGRLHLVSRLMLAVLQRQLAPDGAFQELLDEAVEEARRLIGLAEGKVDLSPVKVLALLGKLAARAGDADTAEEVLAMVTPRIAETPITAWRGYALMLEGEILAARGELVAASARFTDAVALVDAFQIHESLAHVYRARGIAAAAMAEYDWMTRQRGKGVVECLEQCPTINVIDWSLAFHWLGVLSEEAGQKDAAAGFYRQAVEQWSQAKEHAVRREAERRLEALSAAGS